MIYLCTYIDNCEREGNDEDGDVLLRWTPHIIAVEGRAVSRKPRHVLVTHQGMIDTEAGVLITRQGVSVLPREIWYDRLGLK